MLKSFFRFWNRPIFSPYSCRFTEADYEEVEKHYPFVQLLDRDDKEKFYHRLCKLLKSFQLHKRGEVELSRTDIILIGVPAVILTFGFTYFHWGHFKHLFVYPYAYKSRVTGAYHHGETSPLGSIVVSWKRVQEGLEDPDDALHLLYHEYAHVMVLSRRRSARNEDENFMSALNELVRIYSRRRDILESELIREYGFTNGMEFFAVIVELFMERADDFKKDHPQLYHRLLTLLKLQRWEEAILQQASWFR